MTRATQGRARRSNRSTASREPGAPAKFAERIGPPNDAFEQQADQIASAVIRAGRINGGVAWSTASPPGTIQRMCAECEEEWIQRAPKDTMAPRPPETSADVESSDSGMATGTAEPAETPALQEANAGREASRSAGLIVADEANASAGQLRKSEFLATLRKEICATVDAALVETGRDSQGCPWIDHWIGYYEGRSAAQIEGALLRYAPEAAGAATARDYVHLVSVRVGRSAATWARTGELEGLPDDVPASPALGGGVLGAFGGMFFKAQPGGARPANPVSVRTELGSGQPLPTSVRSQMEPAFGVSFSAVRLHNDASAAQLANQMNARAFTLGRDVAFGAGEYQPGTIAGDALIAHELAHVVQQGGGAITKPSATGGLAEGALEKDADAAAAGAVSAAVNPRSGRMSGGRTIRPQLQSGLRLQRCGSSSKPAAAPNLKTDKVLRQRWEDAFQDGITLLDKSLSAKGETRGCRFTNKKAREEWEFDEENWRRIVGEEETRKYRVAYTPRKAPHVSVDELFNHLERWECDCALFPELTWLYAWRHTLSDAEFDAKFSNLRLRVHETFEGELHTREGAEMEIESGNFNALWNSAPVGTKVNWVNDSKHAREPWTHENAVKTKKGTMPEQDLYYAHPIGKDKTEAQVRRALAENSEDFPGRPFVVTDDTLTAVQGAGAPSDFINGLALIRGQVFIGKAEFWKAIAKAQQALVPLKAANEQQYIAIMTMLFDTAHRPATEAEKEKYVATFIKRDQFRVPTEARVDRT